MGKLRRMSEAWKSLKRKTAQDRALIRARMTSAAAFEHGEASQGGITCHFGGSPIGEDFASSFFAYKCGQEKTDFGGSNGQENTT